MNREALELVAMQLKNLSDNWHRKASWHEIKAEPIPVDEMFAASNTAADLHRQILDALEEA